MIHQNSISLWGPALLIVIALIWGGLRVLYLSRKQNVSVLAVMAKTKSTEEKLASFVAIILDGYLLIRPIYPQVDAYVFTISHPFSSLGVLVMAFGIGLAILSQIDMGKSWRIGIPTAKEESQSLITGGLYQYSRNPIYVGIMVFLIGSFIAATGPITLFGLLSSALLIGKIIESEEAFMRTSFGSDYDCYCKEVRRWL